MKMLEQKAQQLAAEAEQDKPKPKDKILFVRYVLRPSLKQATLNNQSMQVVWHRLKDLFKGSALFEN